MIKSLEAHPYLRSGGVESLGAHAHVTARLQGAVGSTGLGGRIGFSRVDSIDTK
jgi:hypothetical protein